MSKQHIADMLKSIASNDMEGAKAHFSKYATEKSQEILSRDPEGTVTEPEVTEPEVSEPIVTEPEVSEPVVNEPEVSEPVVTEPEVSGSEA
jgi:hypothetical protein